MIAIIFAAAILVPEAAVASTACYVYVQGDCHGWVPAGTWFADGASSSDAACLHRARDYAQWCGLRGSGDQVNAAYVMDGVTINAQVWQPSPTLGGPVVTTYGMNWVALATSALESYQSGLPTPMAPVNVRLNPRALPLGDQRYVTAGPRRGYIYACDPMMFQQVGAPGASAEGSWVNEAAGTYDVTAKVTFAGQVYFSDAYFSVTASADRRYVRSNGLPVGVPTGIFPVQTSDPAYVYDRNPNAITTQDIAFSVPRNPVVSGAYCIYKEVGITLDGVPLHGPLDSTGDNELAHEIQDVCTGGPQPGGGYHRHALSTCTPHIHERNALVGYALDGFGISSPFDEYGNELTSADLDECHGRTSPIMWEGRLVNMYHYVLTRDFPYSVSCFRGRPTRNAFPALPGAPPQTK